MYLFINKNQPKIDKLFLLRHLIWYFSSKFRVAGCCLYGDGEVFDATSSYPSAFSVKLPLLHQFIFQTLFFFFVAQLWFLATSSWNLCPFPFFIFLLILIDRQTKGHKLHSHTCYTQLLLQLHIFRLSSFHFISISLISHVLFVTNTIVKAHCFIFAIYLFYFLLVLSFWYFHFLFGWMCVPEKSIIFRFRSCLSHRLIVIFSLISLTLCCI